MGSSRSGYASPRTRQGFEFSVAVNSSRSAKKQDPMSGTSQLVRGSIQFHGRRSLQTIAQTKAPTEATMAMRSNDRSSREMKLCARAVHRMHSTARHRHGTPTTMVVGRIDTGMRCQALVATKNSPQAAMTRDREDMRAPYDPVEGLCKRRSTKFFSLDPDARRVRTDRWTCQWSRSTAPRKGCRRSLLDRTQPSTSRSPDEIRDSDRTRHSNRPARPAVALRTRRSTIPREYAQVPCNRCTPRRETEPSWGNCTSDTAVPARPRHMRANAHGAG